MTVPTAASLALDIRHDIDNNQIQLPTLPEVALKVRDAVEQETADAHAIAAMIAQDPALSARLIQVANSPLYRGRIPIDTLQMAVTRMGLKLVRSLTVSLAMKQIFQATSPSTDDQFRKIWADSVEIAALSRYLAGNVPGMDLEQAMLAGLIHNIGALPILARLDETVGFELDAASVAALLDEISPATGEHMLRLWNFTPALVNVPVQCLAYARNPAAQADYADVVMVARLQNLLTTGRDGRLGEWDRIPAFAKVGLVAEEIVIEAEGALEHISQIRALLHG